MPISNPDVETALVAFPYDPLRARLLARRTLYHFWLSSVILLAPRDIRKSKACSHGVVKSLRRQRTVRDLMKFWTA